jgi:hypothetical protein
MPPQVIGTTGSVNEYSIFSIVVKILMSLTVVTFEMPVFQFVLIRYLNFSGEKEMFYQWL